MTTSEQAAREAEVAAIMAGGQEAINRYLITGMMDLRANGCGRKCDEQPESAVARWTPAAVGTALTGVAIGILEWFRK
jgi:hypothetical protein